MSSDSKHFVAPERYPSPPKDMYYEVPKTPTYQKPAPIFPWETNQSKPTRVFAEDREAPKQNTPAPEPRRSPPVEKEQQAELVNASIPESEYHTDPWQNFSAASRNAWDDMPEIQRYVGALQKNRKGNIQIIQGYGSGIEQVSSSTGRRPSIRLTDFPTELERPSLPVTPAPIRRPSFWGEERDDAGDLPAAEGVPSQAEWVCITLFIRIAKSHGPNTSDRIQLSSLMLWRNIKPQFLERALRPMEPKRFLPGHYHLAARVSELAVQRRAHKLRRPAHSEQLRT